MQVTEKLTRDNIIELLTERDGTICMYPNCGKELDLSIQDDSNPMFITVDHWMPKCFGLAEGWTWDEIWDISNLRLMHKKCNASKGDRVPREDGTLPEKPKKTFRYRRQKRASRPELCTQCDNGHNLFSDEICAACGMTAQKFPREAKARYQECDHEILWCIWCSIGVVPRVPAIDAAVRQAESGEWGAEGEG